MRLIIGGLAQGKLDYAMEHYRTENMYILDGEKETTLPEAEQVLFYHLHSWVRKSLAQAPDAFDKTAATLLEWAAGKKECILISDEIGSGIVPMEEEERRWREETGRLCVKLAAQAESVERVICGIAQKLK